MDLTNIHSWKTPEVPGLFFSFFHMFIFNFWKHLSKIQLKTHHQWLQNTRRTAFSSFYHVTLAAQWAVLQGRIRCWWFCHQSAQGISEVCWDGNLKPLQSEIVPLIWIDLDSAFMLLLETFWGNAGWKGWFLGQFWVFLFGFEKLEEWYLPWWELWFSTSKSSFQFISSSFDVKHLQCCWNMAQFEIPHSGFFTF